MPIPWPGTFPSGIRTLPRGFLTACLRHASARLASASSVAFAGRRQPVADRRIALQEEPALVVTLISRVLTNMLENAVRHAPKGTPITIGAAPGPSGTVVVSVADLLGQPGLQDLLARAAPG
jgi:signal transduction histidine kinase